MRLRSALPTHPAADRAAVGFEVDGTLRATPVGGPPVSYWSERRFEILGGGGIGSANHGHSTGSGLALIPAGFDAKVIAIRVTGPKPPGDG